MEHCDARFSEVLNIKAGLQIVYDALRRGLHGFGNYPCRYVAKQVPPTNTGPKIEYDSSWRGGHVGAYP